MLALCVKECLAVDWMSPICSSIDESEANFGVSAAQRSLGVEAGVVCKSWCVCMGCLWCFSRVFVR
jgi:hypothetical protein